MKLRLGLAGLLVGYVLLLQPFTQHMADRPVQVKLGYLPHPQLIKAVSGEHRTSVAAMIMLRVIFYYGTILQKFQEGVQIRPEYLNIYKMLQGVGYIDPYNMDSYYFAQAAFTWEIGRIREVNFLLKTGMKFRTWDYWLPFYIGFNDAYFLKDFKQAAYYMSRAAEISGNPLFTRLASRYFYESEQMDLGLKFLDTEIRQAKDPAIKKTFVMRRDALLAVKKIEGAIQKYQGAFGHSPPNLQSLVSAGLLAAVPADPYGGEFYLDEAGKVRSSSKFAQPIAPN